MKIKYWMKRCALLAAHYKHQLDRARPNAWSVWHDLLNVFFLFGKIALQSASNGLDTIDAKNDMQIELFFSSFYFVLCMTICEEQTMIYHLIYHFYDYVIFCEMFLEYSTCILLLLPWIYFLLLIFVLRCHTDACALGHNVNFNIISILFVIHVFGLFSFHIMPNQSLVRWWTKTL